MKETVLDVLMYLFETYVDAEEDPEPDPEALRDQLEQAGFFNPQIDQALDWLDGLNEAVARSDESAAPDRAVRLFAEHESARLDAESRGYLLYLEQLGILSPAQRELVIDRLLALGNEDIDTEKIKWVVLLVLFSQPGQEVAFARMENLVFDGALDTVH